MSRVFAALDHGGRPILVCGHERSGTNWILRTLGRAPGALCYLEPCLWYSTPGASESVQASYLRTGQPAPHFERALDGAFAGLTVPSRIWRARSPKLLRRALPGHRVVVKEVNTLMSIEWVADRYDPLVVIPVRHPCPVVLSQLDRGVYARGWLDVLAADDRLMADHLEPYRPVLTGATTPVAATAALWAARNRVVADQLGDHPDWRVAVYEDLARDPIGGFRALYDGLGLRWTRRVERYVTRTTTTPDTARFGTTRVSADQIDGWRSSMTAAQIAEVREVTEVFDLPWYGASDGAFDLD